MSAIKSDLHVHIDRNINRDALIFILKSAEKENVKCLSLLEHNNIDLYKPNGVLADIINNEGIETYYSGKLISGCEYDCRIEKANTNDRNYDYNGNIVHILVYGFDPIELLKNLIYNEANQQKNWLEDLNSLLNIGNSLGLKMPSVDMFDYNNQHYVKQLYNYLMQDEERKNKFIDVLGITPEYLANDSVFFRKLFNEREGKLHFNVKSVPTIQEILKIANEYNAKAVIAHPAYMNNDFLPHEYVNTLLNIPTNDEREKFWGVEGNYMLNTKEENKLMVALSKHFNLKLTGGSDYQYFRSEKNPEGKMYFMLDNGEKMYYVPKPGFAIKSHLNNENEEILIDSEVLNELPDVRQCYVNKNIEEQNQNSNLEF